MRGRVPGFVVALLTFALCQGFEAWMLYGLDIGARRPIDVVPFFDLRMAWNTGISYSFLRADSATGRFMLVALALVMVAVLAVWLMRTARRLTGVALGLLIGGALSNAVDRAVHGAVADFFHLHFGGVSPFGVFNLADVAITGGVALLLGEALLFGNRAPKKHPVA